MPATHILVLAASLRTGSFNRQLADLVGRRLEEAGANVTRLEPGDYALPIYDADLENRAGVPSAALALHEQFRSHQGIFIASPEYNASASPLLINLLAWVSRVSDHGGMAAAFGAPVFALGSASPGGFGGYRGLMALRNSLELQLGARVLPTMVSVSSVKSALTPLEAVGVDGGHLGSKCPDAWLGRRHHPPVVESVKSRFRYSRID
ncbi:NAD(P)H-dependent oxidoreductase [Sphingomonas sp. H39-1-10]|nr:NAD(P)H-dependent oxidoreductase [Sphingomonas pollutisoli]MDF0491439.1 NAD(P)H-dependent oxidoreductase [Sphingomonas pollutisoli]